ncbi:hypothetical protein ACFVVX_08970 [Kitasatospora sp. NPDC058170]|uniref:hypothetical protein n=1 Tax=Kitasatospora sp. NPDC058170 TaxID=3346364 RepID=UPI0036DA8AFC
MLTTAAALGALGTALIVAAPAGAATASDPTDPTGTPATTCEYRLQSGLATKLCTTVSSGTVRFTGQIGLAGPPSPGSPFPQPQQLNVVLTADAGTDTTLGTLQRTVTFQTQPLEVGAVGGAVACGSTAHASFSVSSFGRYTTPVTTDVLVPC